MEYKDVEKRGNLWGSYMIRGGRKVSFGVYASAEIAAAVHDLGVKMLGGPREDLNFPDETAAHARK